MSEVFKINVDLRPHRLVSDRKIEGDYIYLGGHSEIINQDGSVEKTETVWNLRSTYDPTLWKMLQGLDA